MSASPTNDVIPAAMSSFTPITTRRKTFCLSALSCALERVVILGVTGVVIVLAVCEDILLLDCVVAFEFSKRAWCLADETSHAVKQVFEELLGW